MPVLGGQDAIQLLDEVEEFLAVLLHCDKRTESVDTVDLVLLHAFFRRNRGSITVLTVAGMFDVEHLGFTESGMASLKREAEASGQPTQACNMVAECGLELFKDSRQLGWVSCVLSPGAEIADAVFQAARAGKR